MPPAAPSPASCTILTCSAPVDICRKHLKGGKARAILVNAGNSNAFTGKAESTSVERRLKATAKALKCQPEEICITSTGVIGELLNDKAIIDNLPAPIKDLQADPGTTAPAPS